MWRSLHPRKVWYVIFPFYQGVVLIQIYCLVCLFISDAKIGAARRLQCEILRTKRFFIMFLLTWNIFSGEELPFKNWGARKLFCFKVMFSSFGKYLHRDVSRTCLHFPFLIVLTFVVTIFPPLMLVVSSCLVRLTLSWLRAILDSCVWDLSTGGCQLSNLMETNVKVTPT